MRPKEANGGGNPAPRGQWIRGLIMCGLGDEAIPYEQAKEIQPRTLDAQKSRTWHFAQPDDFRSGLDCTPNLLCLVTHKRPNVVHMEVYEVFV